MSIYTATVCGFQFYFKYSLLIWEWSFFKSFAMSSKLTKLALSESLGSGTGSFALSKAHSYIKSLKQKKKRTKLINIKKYIWMEMQTHITAESGSLKFLMHTDKFQWIDKMLKYGVASHP